MTPRRGLKVTLWLGVTAAIVFLCILSPPIRILSLDAVRQKEEQAAFHPEAFARDVFDNKLPNALETAVDARLLKAPDAKERHALIWGIGDVYYYFVSGTGHVRNIEEDAVHLSLDASSSQTDIILLTDHIFGNAVRNGIGVVNPSDFPNSRDLNNISIELNKIIQNEVLPSFRETVTVGKRVRFVGCAEIKNETNDLRPMKVVPVQVEME